MHMESYACASLGEPPAISDELQAELRRMEERLKVSIKKEILAELASQSGPTEDGTSASKGEEAEEQDVDDSQEVVKYAQDDRPWECALEGSVWDAVLLVGTPVLGGAGTAFIALLIALNLAMQAVFIHVVSTAFTSSAYTSESLDQLRTWRRNVAHDITHMDPVTRKSLALRVCEKDSGLAMSGSQVSQFAVLDEYLNSGIGAIMCALGIVCWCLSVSREINRCFDVAYAVACLPRGDRTVVSRGGDAVRVGAASTARVALVFAALACRFAFALLLLGYGITFIINTVGIGDLLLNAVALEARAHAPPSPPRPAFSPEPTRPRAGVSAPCVSPRVARARPPAPSPKVTLPRARRVSPP